MWVSFFQSLNLNRVHLETSRMAISVSRGGKKKPGFLNQLKCPWPYVLALGLLFPHKTNPGIRNTSNYLLKVKSRNKPRQDPNLVKYFVVLGRRKTFQICSYNSLLGGRKYSPSFLLFFSCSRALCGQILQLGNWRKYWKSGGG